MALLLFLTLLLVSSLVEAAPVRTGTPITVNATSANTGSATVTVPSDAELMVCAVSGYDATAGFFSAPDDLSLGGTSNDFTTVTGGDSNTSLWMGMIAYRLTSGLTGTQTLAWDWSGTGTADGGNHLIMCSWYKGLDTGTPVRSSSCGAQDAANSHETGTLTAQSGDLIVAFVSQFCGSECTFSGWTNATEVTEFNKFGNADGALAEGSPTGDVAVTGVDGSASNDGTVCAVTIKPAAGGGGGTPPKRVIVY